MDVEGSVEFVPGYYTRGHFGRRFRELGELRGGRFC